MSEIPNPIPKRASLFRRLFSRTSLRRWLFVLACLATLLAVFYAVENWRGKKAWENCRRELEAKGEVLDWNAYIPAPVLDDQNIFKASKMKEWFVKESWQDFLSSQRAKNTNAPRPFALAPRKETSLLIAEIKVVPPGATANPQPADAVLRFDDPAAREQVTELLLKAIGPCAIGAKMCVLVGRPLEHVLPLRLVLQADTVPTPKELTAFFPRNPLTNSALASSDISYLRVDPAGSNSFRVSLKEPVYAAADCLAWTEPQTADFDLIRKALERPYARMDCDYQRPFGIAFPNFVVIRDVAQTLSQRAQSYLLLGQPEAAWHELALVHDLCRVLLAEPNGKPVTLVGAMINVAVTGLYAGIVEDGLRLHAWREPQLLVLERQLKHTDLLWPVVEALREERAATCRTLEVTKPDELVKLFNLGSSQRAWRQKLNDSMFVLVLTCMPRGWFYQNMVVGSALEQELVGGVDLTNRLVLAQQLEKQHREMDVRFKHTSPYTFLTRMGFPNFVKAVQTLARNQTLVNQAGLACALERYRLAQGQYPESLDALVPRFIEQPPHDLIGGQPLKYLRTPNGRFVLYSIGWNEKDDGGVPGKTTVEGDWVWSPK